MKKVIFNLNEEVKIVTNDYFKGLEGKIVDVTIDYANNTLYGIKINETIIYLLAKDLDCII